MKSWILVLLIAPIVNSFSQQPAQNIDQLLEKAKVVRSKNIDSAVYYSKQARAITKQQDNIQLKARAAYFYSYYLITTNQFDEALSEINFNIQHKDDISYELLGSTYFNLGSLYYLKEQYDEAISSFMEAEQLFSLDQSMGWVSRSRLQLSVIYSKLGNAKMESFFAEGSLAVMDLDNEHSRGIIPTTISEKIVFLKNQLETGKHPKNVRSHLLYDLGKAYFENTEYEKSIERFKESLKTKAEMGYSNLVPETNIHIAEAYLKINEPSTSLLFLQKTQAKHKRKQALRIENINTEAYKELKDYEMALFHNERLAKLQDSINNLHENENIAEITGRYDTKQKEKQIIALQQENEKAETIINKQQKRWMYWLSLAALLSISTVWMGRRWKRSQNVVIQVQKEKEIIQKKAEAQHLLLNNKTKLYLKELQFVKSDGNYVEFHSIERKTMDRNKLKNILSKLPPNFVRVHRSYIVNKNEIESFNSHCVLLKSGQEIPLSRTFKSNLR